MVKSKISKNEKKMEKEGKMKKVWRKSLSKRKTEDGQTKTDKKACNAILGLLGAGSGGPCAIPKRQTKEIGCKRDGLGMQRSLGILRLNLVLMCHNC